MRHQVAGRHLNRDTNARKGLFKNLVRDLVEHGHMITTEPKAKELRRIANKLIHKAQTDSLTNRRVLHQFFGRRDVVNTLIERVAPAMKDRTSGFTSLTKLASRRGDNSSMVKVALMTMPDRVGTLKSETVHAARVKKAIKTATKKVVAQKASPKVVAPVVKAEKANKAAKPVAKRVQKAAV